MLIIHRDRNNVFPEVGDEFSVLVGDPKAPVGHGSKLVKVKVEIAKNSEDCEGCLFKSVGVCDEHNHTQFVCLGEDRHDGNSIKLIPIE